MTASAPQVPDDIAAPLQLGENGPLISRLGIGTWAWGDSLFWGYGKEYGAAQVKDAFAAAIEAGVTLFDTAEVYGFGESERLLGQFRQDWVDDECPVQFATKYFPLPWRFGKQAVADALTASLKRLQVASVELYQVHWPLDFFMGQDTLMDALADEVQQGRIKAIGVSNYSADQMRQAHDFLAKRGIPLAVNQVQYSLLHRKIEANGVLDTARELGVVILAYSPLAQGLLTGKYGGATGKTPEGARKLDPRFGAKGFEKIAPVVKLLAECGDRHDRTVAQVALNWLIAKGIVVPIPGAKNADQACQNAGALGWTMTPEELAAIDQATQAWL